METKNKQAGMPSLLEVRNKLYDNLPSGTVDAFELLKIIKEHLLELDKIIDSPPPKSEAEAEEIIKLVNAYWKFDNFQMPQSSWHDKQALLDELRLLSAPSLNEQQIKKAFESWSDEKGDNYIISKLRFLYFIDEILKKH